LVFFFSKISQIRTVPSQDDDAITARIGENTRPETGPVWPEAVNWS